MRKPYYSEFEPPEIADWEGDDVERGEERCFPLPAVVAAVAATCRPWHRCGPLYGCSPSCYPYRSCSPIYICYPAAAR